MISLYTIRKLVNEIDGALEKVYIEVGKISDEFDQKTDAQSREVEKMTKSGNFSEKYIKEQSNATKYLREALGKRSRVSADAMATVNESADTLRAAVYEAFNTPGNPVLANNIALIKASGALLTEGELDALYNTCESYFDVKAVQALAIGQIDGDEVTKQTKIMGIERRYAVPDISETLRAVDSYVDYAKRIAEDYAGPSRLQNLYAETKKVPGLVYSLRESQAFEDRYRLEEHLVTVYRAFGERFEDDEKKSFDAELNRLKPEERADRDARESVISPLYRTLADKTGDYDFEGAKLVYEPFSKPTSIRLEDSRMPENLWVEVKK